MEDRFMKQTLEARALAHKGILRQARIIEITNVPICPRCRCACHCDMITNKKQKVKFVKTGLCPQCQEEKFWGE